MAAWPEADELKQVLNVESGDWDDTLERVLASAIARVKDDTGRVWDEDEEPTERLAQAALRMAELLAQRPESAKSSDPVYARLLRGSRVRFGVG